MGAHTPGVWWASGIEVGTVPLMTVKICNRVSGSNYREAEANARLIAAAPDLLAALQELLNNGNLELPEDYWAKYKAIIAEATGEKP